MYTRQNERLHSEVACVDGRNIFSPNFTVENFSGVDTSHALVDGAGECDPVPGGHVGRRLLLGGELLVAEQALELRVGGEAHHLAHPRAELPGAGGLPPNSPSQRATFVEKVEKI